jgi:hypothetical protein
MECKRSLAAASSILQRTRVLDLTFAINHNGKMRNLTFKLQFPELIPFLQKPIKTQKTQK